MDVRDQFDIVGPLSADATETAVFLARERATGELVGLRAPARDAAGSMVVVRTLDASMPAGERSCPICSARVTDWRRFCARCGSDISGIEAPLSPGHPEPDALHSALRATGRRLEVLGNMRRAEGGAPVYFARDTDTGEIIAATLERPAAGRPAAAGNYALNLTSFLAAAPGAPLLASAMIAAVSPPPAPPGPPAADGDVKVCPSCGAEFSGATRFCPRDGSGLLAREAEDELVGRVIAERYHIMRRIGHGGMGQVYLAEHVKMGRACAVKVMHRGMTQDVSAVTRFAREASSASRINHPNIATIYDFGETRDRLLYLVMEYVEGQSLAQLLARDGRLPATRALQIAGQIADALSAAHRAGVVHRDLKPDNILLAEAHAGALAERVKVVDFGIAKAIREGSEGLTRTGLVVGTPRYMSPEQLLGNETDGRSDLYSLGCILFEMLAGSHPFAGYTGDRLVTARLTEPTPRLRLRGTGVPAVLDELVARAMATDPSARFASADEMHAALDTLLASAAPVRAPDPPVQPPPVLPTVRRQGPPAAPPQKAPAVPVVEAPPAPRAAEVPSPGSREERRVPAEEQLQPTPVAGRDDQRLAAESEPEISPVENGTSPRVATGSQEQPAADDFSPVATGQRRRGMAVVVAAVLLLSAGGVSYLVFGPASPTEQLPVTPGDDAGQAEAPGVTPQAPAESGRGATSSTDNASDRAIAPPTTGRGAAPAPPPALSETGVRQAEVTSPAAPARARLRLLGSLPAGARILVDGAAIARPADGVLNLEPGMRALRVEAPGHVPANLRRDFAAGATSEWRPRLEPEPQQRPEPPAQLPSSTQTSGAATPTPARPQSFAETVAAEVQRVARELENGQIRPSMPAALEAEWRRVFQQQGSGWRVGVRDIHADSAAGTATFLLVVADAAGRSLMAPADYEASFLRLGAGWRLTELFRR